MNIAKKIKTLLQEAELYHSQGLLNEAMEKYNNAKELVQSNEQLKINQTLVNGISKKILALKEDVIKIEKAPKKPEISANMQDVIKRMVSFSPDKNEDIKALDGAIALAKFGQIKRAISEFDELIKTDSLRVVAAKNMLRCFMALSSMDEAIAQYEQWISDQRFSTIQLDKLRVFLEDILKKEGVEKTLSKREPSEDSVEGADVEEDADIIDINSMGITIYRGPNKGQVVEFKIRFQLGNKVSLLIPIRDKDLIDVFEVGDVIEDIQYYSASALYRGSGTVTSVKEVKIGPLRGDYCVDIKVLLK
jgi:tetratricopeptide (TPR) repeat protein